MVLTYNGKYIGEVEVRLYRNRYITNGSIFIGMEDAVTAEPLKTLTTNVGGLSVEEVAIKDYSENVGVFSFLLENGFITEPHRYVQTNFVSIPVCKLTEKGKQITDRN
jgi:hypothetical protein